MNVFFKLLLYFGVLLSPQLFLQALPTRDSSIDSKGRFNNFDDLPETTTEVANSTNIISSAWRKISNIFSGETTTDNGVEMKQELLSEDKMPENEKEPNRDMRMVPIDFDRHGEDTEWENYRMNGNFNPVDHQIQKRNSDVNRGLSENEKLIETKVRNMIIQHDGDINRLERSQNQKVNKIIPIITEEFDQGETEGERIKRFKDLQPLSDWKTEKIAVDSDPVENLDKENYIEEAKKDDFPFHSFSFEPIIVEDTFSFDITTQPQKELPPLAIEEY